MYCKHCGKRLKDNARFCTFCGAERQGAAPSGLHGTPVNQQPYQISSASVSDATPPLRKKRSAIAIVVAILVIFVGVQFMALSIVGKTMDAAVTDARQDRKSYGQTMPNPNRYRIQYSFSVRGEQYGGNTSLIFKHGIREDQKIKVRYLPYYPAINAPADDTNILAGLFLTSLGSFLLVMGVQGKARMRFRMWGRSRERSVLRDEGRK